MDHIELLRSFLQCPLSNAQEIFEKFKTLPGAISHRGETELEQFVYIPGAREDRVVLVAHADTVWDAAYGNPRENSLILEDGVFRSGDPACGIGADDRAGCAMVWALRNSGHSLLIVHGEEKGKHGARFLRKAYPKLYRELNRHQFMMEMDWAGVGGCLYNQVDNTPAFKSYITDTLGYTDSQAKGGCDLQILCHKICGVNVSTGWNHCHRPTETLDCGQWLQNYEALERFLEKNQPRYPIARISRMKRFAGKVKAKLGALARKLHLRPAK